MTRQQEAPRVVVNCAHCGKPRSFKQSEIDYRRVRGSVTITCGASCAAKVRHKRDREAKEAAQ